MTRTSTAMTAAQGAAARAPWRSPVMAGHRRHAGSRCASTALKARSSTVRAPARCWAEHVEQFVAVALPPARMAADQEAGQPGGQDGGHRAAHAVAVR